MAIKMFYIMHMTKSKISTKQMFLFVLFMFIYVYQICLPLTSGLGKFLAYNVIFGNDVSESHDPKNPLCMGRIHCVSPLCNKNSSVILRQMEAEIDYYYRIIFKLLYINGMGKVRSEMESRWEYKGDGTGGRIIASPWPNRQRAWSPISRIWVQTGNVLQLITFGNRWACGVKRALKRTSNNDWRQNVLCK